MEIKPLTGALGAEIFGADIGKPEDLVEIHDAFARHSVIVIRDQSPTPEEHLAFARSFGDIEINRFFRAVDGHPAIAEVRKEPDQKQAIGEAWHTDHSYDTAPAMCSILHAIEVPDVGGDTVFTSTAAAYGALTTVVQELVGGLQAWHGSAHAFGARALAQSEAGRDGRYRNPEAATQEALHPVVIRHPLSGRSCLYVNPGFTLRIDGLSRVESQGLLQTLYAHTQSPVFQCRVRWRAGDITMWDNRATWHMAINDYHGHRRLMHRVTVAGEVLMAA